METDLSKCGICYESYNLGDSFPRILPNCGHSVCEKCLQNLIQGSYTECPFDKTKYSSSNIASFPKNFALAAMLDQKPKLDSCKLHGEKIDLACVTDRKRICSQCLLLDHRDPRDHIVKSLQELEAAYEERKSKLKIYCQNIDKWSREATESFQSQRSNLEKQIDSYFEEILAIIQAKNKRIKNEVIELLKQEEKKLNCFLAKLQSEKSNALRIMEDSQTIYDIGGDDFQDDYSQLCQTLRNENLDLIASITNLFNQNLSSQKDFYENLTILNYIQIHPNKSLIECQPYDANMAQKIYNEYVANMKVIGAEAVKFQGEYKSNPFPFVPCLPNFNSFLMLEVRKCSEIARWNVLKTVLLDKKVSCKVLEGEKKNDYYDELRELLVNRAVDYNLKELELSESNQYLLESKKKEFVAMTECATIIRWIFGLIMEKKWKEAIVTTSLLHEKLNELKVNFIL